MKTWFNIIIFLVPAAMLLNVHQSKLYQNTEDRINDLLRKQNIILEKNQKIVAEIARGIAPTRIETLIQEHTYQFKKVAPEQILRIIIPESNPSP